ncbi:hypothetical protein GCM10023187_32130 [Nibrella viscosa]|uniref:Uncharacterized protein n=1 Tax=Nibrella viscosa TaxID=1084524 RepID=A0ABP8KK84_9BACT
MNSTLLRRTGTLIGSLFLASGVALLTYIGTGISMALTLLVVVLLFGTIGWLVWQQLPPSRRTFLSRRLRVGVWTGLIATLAYDGCRFALITLTGIQFWPFDIFRLFGQALIGPDQPAIITEIAGLLFHLLNGVSFAIAYTIWFAPSGVLAGIGYALVLEAIMVTVYPGWLGLKALDEFLQVSIVGHLVYGSLVGFLTKRWTKTPAPYPV